MIFENSYHKVVSDEFKMDIDQVECEGIYCRRWVKVTQWAMYPLFWPERFIIIACHKSVFDKTKVHIDEHQTL